MSSATSETNAPAEQARRLRIDELRGESGEKWLDDFRPGSAGCHELLDRSHLVADMVEQFLCDHPACAQDPEWFRLATQAAESLHELYQQVGAAMATAALDE
jgi:hypothetical protein